jgi:hypothetical protein
VKLPERCEICGVTCEGRHSSKALASAGYVQISLSFVFPSLVQTAPVGTYLTVLRDDQAPEFWLSRDRSILHTALSQRWSNFCTTGDRVAHAIQDSITLTDQTGERIEAAIDPVRQWLQRMFPDREALAVYRVILTGTKIDRSVSTWQALLLTAEFFDLPVFWTEEYWSKC